MLYGGVIMGVAGAKGKKISPDEIAGAGDLPGPARPAPGLGGEDGGTFARPAARRWLPGGGCSDLYRYV